MMADTRVLVERMRVEAQTHRRVYGEPVDVRTLARGICDFMQDYTHYGGARPFGTSLLIAGMDSVLGLYEADPSGALIGYKATAIGEGQRTTREFFEKKYKGKMSRDQAVKMALAALRDVNGGKLTEETIDLAIINPKDGYTKLSREKVKGYIIG